MVLTLQVTLAAFTALYALLLIQRISIKNIELELNRIKNLDVSQGGS